MKNTTKTITITAIIVIASLISFSDAPYRIGILYDDLPGANTDLNQQIESTLTERGFEIERIDAETLCDENAIATDRIDLLILPNAASLPIDSVSVVDAYLKQGGDLLALNAPAFSQLLWKSGDEWFSDSGWRKRLAEIPTENTIVDFESTDLSQWHRSSNAPELSATYEIGEGYEGKGLHVRVPNMAGWDTFSTPPLQNPVPEGHSLICFYAKGVGDTRVISLECVEKDGSRWIAVFPISNEWSRIVLAPGDFKFWKSVPNRGGSGDALNPQNIMRMQVGVAWTHTGPRGGLYEYTIDELGTAANPYGDMPRDAETIPRIEGVCPTYKFYPLTDVASITPRWAPLKTIDRSFSVPNTIKAHHPRPTGKGFDKERGWRWIPLLEAFGSNGEWRGAPAGTFINTEGALRGSVRTYFSIEDADWYKQPAVQQALATVVERMSQQVYIIEAGTEYFSYQSGEPIHYGMHVVNFSNETLSSYTMQWDVVKKETPMKQEVVSGHDFSLLPDDITRYSCDIPISKSYMPQPGQRTEMTVLSTLRHNQVDVDAIESDLTFFEPKPESDRRFVTTRDGDFIRDGHKWYVHGVNYMPSTGIGVETQSYFEYWMNKTAYDPEFIQRDLERCRDIGLNSVSIFIYHNTVESRNLLDILQRCEHLGLAVNLSIRPGTPMKYDWNQWKEIIESHRLWEWDVIYAYDIAWEPFFGTEPQRRAYDEEWRKWIVQHHDSIKNAEEYWGDSAPRLSGQVTSPSTQQLGNDGPHRVTIADYRRFVDELIEERYSAAKANVLSVDPNHLVSFRMTVTGDPTYNGAENMPYDFMGVADCMDFLAPEGYGRIGGWERIKPGIFTVAYGRFCAPDKPVLWAEAGVHAWNQQDMISDPDLLDYQGRFFENFYKMVLQSNSNGIVWWWYPGGYRANERSDYGIINPDGTDRPNTKIIRQYADKILAERTIPKPDVYIPIDRDADARGLYGIYDRVKDDFWKAIEEGKTPGLKQAGNDASVNNAMTH